MGVFYCHQEARVYHIGLTKPLRARHFLIGGDWGRENRPHAHDYRVEWVLAGPTLDEHGYLLDLTAVEGLLDSVLADLRGSLLNDLPVFQGLNPSVERLAHFVSDQLIGGRDRWDPQHRLAESTVKVYETKTAWASWSTTLDSGA